MRFMKNFQPERSAAFGETLALLLADSDTAVEMDITPATGAEEPLGEDGDSSEDSFYKSLLALQK